MKNLSPNSNVNSTTIFGNTQMGHHYWIGLLSNGYDYFTGQTFRSPENGTLKSIGIYPEMVIGNTGLKIAVYHFDKDQHQCTEKLTEMDVKVTASDANNWLNFNGLNLHLEKNKNYMFKLSCSHGNMMAIAECGWNSKLSHEGEQWVGHSGDKNGHYYTGFGLTFLAELEKN